MELHDSVDVLLLPCKVYFSLWRLAKGHPLNNNDEPPHAHLLVGKG
jgi:hypothetical protein